MIHKTVLYNDVTVFNILVAVFILVIAFSTAKAMSAYLRRSLKEKVAREHLDILLKVVSYTIIILAALWTLTLLGLNLSGLLVAGGIAGIVLGFASQSIVGNLISGIFLIIERPIRIGNQVSVEGVLGFVEDIKIISTVIRTYDGLYVRIPNQKVFTSSITNFVGNVARRFEYIVGIRYSDDADKAIDIIKGLVEDHPFALKNPSPLIFVDNLGDNAVNIAVKVWAPSSDWYGVKTELLWKIKKSLEQEGIEIAFPQRVMWFANELNKREVVKNPSEMITQD
ncbi:MAG: mechanosensitive ion channel family protein [Thermodesulfobacteriota bacterium]|nr:mechanosensitive ion channel family protein [Thermodesulfobacteriota bacterium]